MRNFLFVFGGLVVLIISSCRKDFSTIPSFGNLTFSKDTIFLDTVFTTIGSATYNLRVYNKSDKAITIPEIKLENGVNSYYRLNVDGVAGKNFEDIDILANDSLYVFIETTIDFSNVSNPLYTDRILFDNGNNQQDVDLVTLVQDATFIYPDRNPVSMVIDSLTLDGQPTSIKGRFLEDSELTFTNERPYVIYGYAAIASGKTVTFEAGAEIYFHANSGLIVDEGATMVTNGTLTEKVTFQGDRLEAAFDNIAGQWGTIWLRAGSTANNFNHTIIKNGTIGILVDSLGTNNNPTLFTANTEIYNQSSFGILGREAEITAENLVIGNAGQSSLAATVGGNYNFTHCTFSNYWNNSFRSLPTVLVNNFFTKQENGQNIIETRPLIAANFSNCIVYGNNNIEFVLDKVDGNEFNYNVNNSIIRFEDPTGIFADNSDLDFNNPNYQNVIINGNPDFRNPFDEDLIIGENSTAINAAAPTAVSQDILGIDRTSSPDIGAYQHIIFN
ncbi:hypothetical protein [Tenacibaculum geojense]|uniref:Lipoprotein n=1 Tax=Tenacibaculum geojense TaxID=915352 RepID=A0ABW3JRA2_9FLAO